MKTIGEIFTKTRIAKNISPEEVERVTKIRKKYIFALENGDYQKLPSATFTRGFVKNYSDYLGLKTGEILALYRREYDEQKDKRLLPKSISHHPEENLFHLNPRRFAILVICFLLTLFFTYVFWQYAKLSGAPTLIITSPVDNLVVNNKDLEISGKTDPDAIIKINDQVISNKDGKFSQFFTLTVGLNTITIESIAKNGKISKSDKHVRLIDQ